MPQHDDQQEPVDTPATPGSTKPEPVEDRPNVGVVEPGDLMLMHGSTTFFVLVQDKPTPDTRVWTVAGASPGRCNLAAGMSTTGSLTRWFKDELARDLTPAEGYASLFAAAAGVPAGAGGLLVLPYFSGERTPINDPDAKGIIAGLTLAHTREHLFRAMLEGVGFGVRHNLEAFAQIGARVDRIVAVGGGAQSDTWLQIISDIANVSQLVPQVTIGASYGDAFLAGRAAGLLKASDINAWVQPGRTIQPDPTHRALYDRMYPKYLRLYENTKDLMHEFRSHA